MPYFDENIFLFIFLQFVSLEVQSRLMHTSFVYPLWMSIVAAALHINETTISVVSTEKKGKGHTYDHMWMRSEHTRKSVCLYRPLANDGFNNTASKQCANSYWTLVAQRPLVVLSLTEKAIPVGHIFGRWPWYRSAGEINTAFGDAPFDINTAMQGQKAVAVYLISTIRYYLLALHGRILQRAMGAAKINQSNWLTIAQYMSVKKNTFD